MLAGPATIAPHGVQGQPAGHDSGILVNTLLIASVIPLSGICATSLVEADPGRSRHPGDSVSSTAARQAAWPSGLSSDGDVCEVWSDNDGKSCVL